MKTMIFKKGMNWTMICIVSMMTMVLASCMGPIVPISPVNKKGELRKRNLVYSDDNRYYGMEDAPEVKDEILAAKTWFYNHYRGTGNKSRKAWMMTTGQGMDWYYGDEGVDTLAGIIADNFSHAKKYGYIYYPFTGKIGGTVSVMDKWSVKKYIHREFNVDIQNLGSFVTLDKNYNPFIAIEEDNVAVKGEIAARVVRELTRYIPMNEEYHKMDKIRGYKAKTYTEQARFVYPRINELRFMAGMQPGDKVTVEDIENFRKYAADYNDKIMALAENETVTITPTCFPDPGILNLDAELLCRYINETD